MYRRYIKSIIIIIIINIIIIIINISVSNQQDFVKTRNFGSFGFIF